LVREPSCRPLAGKRAYSPLTKATAFQAVVHDCGSGKELVERGFGGDVEMASEYAVSSAVPMLAWDRFVNGPAWGA